MSGYVRRMLVVTASCCLFVPTGTSAHHARSAYDTGTFTEVEGELVSVEWRNPHIVFTLRVIDESGEEELWRMEAGSIYMLRRGGVSPELFTSGDRVKVAGHLSISADRDFLATNMLFADGREVLTMPGATARYAEQVTGGRSRWVGDGVRLERTRQDSNGIFKVWSIPRGNAVVSQHRPFTESAVAARANWDPTHNWATRCEQPGMPRIMFNPHPFEFIDAGSTITLLGEEFDMVRTIHMDASADPDRQPTSNMGYSVGHWEGNTLVVETNRIDWPFFDSIGTPQSDAVEIVERFALSDGETRLDYHIKITDPATFTEPAVIERYWLALGETVEPYECEVY